MHALIPLPRRTLPLWLAAFFSPTAYFLLLLLADKFRVPAPPDVLVAALFYLIPAIGLLICEYIFFTSGMASARKVRWMLFTLFAMILQACALLAIIVTAIG